MSEDVPPEERHRSFLHKPFLSKSAISIAGPLANLLLPIALFFGLFVGDEKVADAVVGTVLPGEPAEAAGLKPGDRIVRVDGKPVQVFSDLQKVVEGRPGVPLHLGVVRNGEPLDLTATPRAAASPTPFEADRKVGRLGLIAALELPSVVVEQHSPAFAAGLRTKDKIVAVDGAPVRTRDELLAALDARKDAPWTFTVERTDDKGAAQKLTIAVPAESGAPAAVKDDRFAVTAEELAGLKGAMDPTRAVTERAAQERAQRRGLSPVDGLVTYVAEGTVAAETRVAVDHDRIVAVDGKAVRTPGDLEAALQSSPHAIHVVGVLGDDGGRVIAFRMGPPPQRQLKSLRVFGAALGVAYGDEAVVVRHVGAGEALRRGVEATAVTVKEVVDGFALLFSGKVGLESLGGPITIFNLAGQAAQADGTTYIHLMAVLSVNLGLINLLPIPVLDGGHLLLFIVEAVQRKRLSIETRIKATKIGFVLVAILMVIAIGNDILGLF